MKTTTIKTWVLARGSETMTFEKLADFGGEDAGKVFFKVTFKVTYRRNGRKLFTFPAAIMSVEGARGYWRDCVARGYTQ